MQLSISLDYGDIQAIQQNAGRAADFIKMLGNKDRLMILCYLAQGEKSVGELQRLINMRQANLSQQLANLRARNIIRNRREAKNVFYSIADDNVYRIIGVLYDMFCG